MLMAKGNEGHVILPDQPQMGNKSSTVKFGKPVEIRSEDVSTKAWKQTQNNTPVVIKVHPDTDDPNAAWKGLKKGQKIREVEPKKWSVPISEDSVRFVCLSDTHSKVEHKQRFVVPDADVLLFAGDMTMSGSCEELIEFNKFMGRLQHIRHKLVIAGNHDFQLDDASQPPAFSKGIKQERLNKYGVDKASELLTNCTLLQDELVEVAGLKIYGSPWVPMYGCHAFSLFRGAELLDKWNMIPECTDILLTHAPPAGIGDEAYGGCHAGCVELLNTIQHRVKPRYHVFGHIHEGYGMYTDGTCMFINASICAQGYDPDNLPIVFDLPIPKGHSKTEPVKYCGSFRSDTIRDQSYNNKFFDIKEL